MSNELVPQDAEDFDVVHPMPFPMAEEAVIRFLESGSLAQVGRELHIPVQDLYRASKTPWWIQEVGLRKRMERAASDAKMTRLLDKTLDEIEDRLLNGEDFVDAKGGTHKKNVPAMALARLADVLFEKRQQLRGEPGAQDKATRKLTELADKLEQFGRAAQAKPILEMPASEGGVLGSGVSDATPK